MVGLSPDRLNRAAWLFCGVSEGTSGEQLAKSDVYSILRKTKKRAGITKKIYPHLFRHTRATILASKVAEAPLESQMDWVHGSRTDKDICPSITKGSGQRNPESIRNQNQ